MTDQPSRKRDDKRGLARLLPTPTVHRHAWARVRFLVEQLILGGGQYRLIVVVIAVVALSLLGGSAVRSVDPSFTSFGEAVWWAFLRLTDPGYLGDDQGFGRRVISTVMTLLGYVVFLGALIAIMTQWLNAWMTKMASGASPIVARDHIVLLGWNNRTVAMVRELFLSRARLRRFLSRLGSRRRRLRVAVLIEKASETHYQEILEGTGPEVDRWDLAIRTGTPLRLEHLYRVDATRAAAIILAGDDNLTPSIADGETIKTLMSASAAGSAEGLPLVVAEVFDPHNIEHAQAAYPGPLEVVAGNLLCAQVMTQNIRHPGLSHLHVELLSYLFGNEIYVRPAPERLVGKPITALDPHFTTATVLGVVRGEGEGCRAILSPPPEERVQEGDRVVVVAEEYDLAAPRTAGVVDEDHLSSPPTLVDAAPRTRRILALGWNHRAPSLLKELASHPSEKVEVTVLSAVPVELREQALTVVAPDPARLHVHHVVGDLARAHDVEPLDPASFDNVVVLASDRIEADARVDARTLLGVMVLQRAMEGTAKRPPVLVELMEAQNAQLVHERGCEVLISPLLISQVLTLIALRRELHCVLKALFGPEGADITFAPPEELGVEGSITFRELQRRARAQGLTALGVVTDGTHRLNPGADTQLNLSSDDQVVLLVPVRAAA